MNPCPCGYYGDARQALHLPPRRRSPSYQKRISGPLLDRFDLFIDVPRIEYRELTGDTTGESSAAVRERVSTVRELQRGRLAATPYITNSEMGPLEVREFCQQRLATAAQPLLASAMERLALSARGFHRLLKVSRTIADLAGSDSIEAAHLAEAVQYRRRAAE